MSIDSAVGPTETPIKIVGTYRVDGIFAGAVKQKLLVRRLIADVITLHLTTFSVAHISSSISTNWLLTKYANKQQQLYICTTVIDQHKLNLRYKKKDVLGGLEGWAARNRFYSGNEGKCQGGFIFRQLEGDSSRF